MRKKLKDNQLSRFINVRFRADKFKRLDEIAGKQNISRPELIRKILLDYIDVCDSKRR